MAVDEYSVCVLGAQEWDSKYDNVDVEVRFADGRRYAATFFTIENLKRLFAKNRTTGECLDGTYLWASDMILVEELSVEVIVRTVADLIKMREFESSFSRQHSPDDSR